ncbi:hypothetical protein [Ruegeria sp. ANG-R]|uniref:hypothetical protein n=1 Tax=Ruegeria sp. ANG-R TaxID=1577903 RepID=UPI00068C5385|nr:hypothetical protein [Ruegeria sp. ANG-R]
MAANKRLSAALFLTLAITGCTSDVQSLDANRTTSSGQSYTPPLIERVVPVFTPVINVPQGPKRLSSSDVEQAILRGAGARDQWFVTNKQPGQVDLTVVVRSHQARVKVLYNTNTVSINLVDSTNLMQSVDKIHRNYNKWVILLQREIETELLKKAGGSNS